MPRCTCPSGDSQRRQARVITVDTPVDLTRDRSAELFESIAAARKLVQGIGRNESTSIRASKAPREARQRVKRLSEELKKLREQNQRACRFQPPQSLQLH